MPRNARSGSEPRGEECKLSWAATIRPTLCERPSAPAPPRPGSDRRQGGWPACKRSRRVRWRSTEGRGCSRAGSLCGYRPPRQRSEYSRMDRAHGIAASFAKASFASLMRRKRHSCHQWERSPTVARCATIAQSGDHPPWLILASSGSGPRIVRPKYITACPAMYISFGIG